MKIEVNITCCANCPFRRYDDFYDGYYCSEQYGHTQTIFQNDFIIQPFCPFLEDKNGS